LYIARTMSQMKIVAINTEIKLKNFEVISVTPDGFDEISLKEIDYVVISGGDGLLRRMIEKIIQKGNERPTIIIDAKGSFNVIAKRYMIPKLHKVIGKLENKEKLQTRKMDVYKLNSHIFLFSAGNLTDALHIHLSEILRVGFLRKGPLRYLISGIFVLPVTLLSFPFLLFSKKRFFIFTPFKLINFKNHYTKINHLHFDIKNDYNILEIDGDLVILKERYIDIKKIDEINIIVK